MKFAGQMYSIAKRFTHFDLVSRRINDKTDNIFDNCFTLFRCVFASAVIFSHAFVLTGAAAIDPTRHLMPYAVSRLAVYLFFCLSGFVVMGSLERHNIRTFLALRVLRIVPGLLVMLISTSLASILFFSGDGISNLYQLRSVAFYIFSNSLFLGGHYSIADTFQYNKLPEVVNGSLWTIPYEVRCYLVLAAISLLGLLKRPRIILSLFAILVITHLTLPSETSSSLYQLRSLAIVFLLGASLYNWRSYIPLSRLGSLLLIAGSFLIDDKWLSGFALAITAGYATIVFGYGMPVFIRRFSLSIPDYSYGIYIYAFPAQQIVFALGIGVSPYSNMLSAYILTLCLAVMSWHIIEGPALRQKANIMRLTSKSWEMVVKR